MKKTILAVGLMAGLLMAGKSEATLFDRLNGLIYDDVNNISWTKVAGDGVVRTWAEQVSWADGFTLAGFDDFRLASIGELASLYGQLPGASDHVPLWPKDKTGDNSPFEDIQFTYWSGTEFSPLWAWCFFFFDDRECVAKERFTGYGWAVRPGDSVAAVPEPGTAVLLGLGLLGLRLARRWGR